MDTPGQFVYKRGHNAITVNLSDVALKTLRCCRKMMINYSKLKDLFCCDAAKSCQSFSFALSQSMFLTSHGV